MNISPKNKLIRLVLFTLIAFILLFYIIFHQINLNFDSTRWKECRKKKYYCGEQDSLAENLMVQEGKLKHYSEKDIIDLLGKADTIILSSEEGNKAKALVYFLQYISRSKLTSEEFYEVEKLMIWVDESGNYINLQIRLNHYE